MQVRNTQARLLLIYNQRLVPGVNVLDVVPELCERIKANEQFQTWKSLGWVECFARAATPDPIDPVSGVGVRKAIEYIKQCSDPERLLGWFESETRTTVLAAIEDRVSQLDKG